VVGILILKLPCIKLAIDWKSLPAVLTNIELFPSPTPTQFGQGIYPSSCLLLPATLFFAKSSLAIDC